VSARSSMHITPERLRQFAKLRVLRTRYGWGRGGSCSSFVSLVPCCGEDAPITIVSTACRRVAWFGKRCWVERNIAMPDSPLTREQAAQIWQELRFAALRFASLHKAAEDAGWEIPDEIRRQLIALRQQFHVDGVPWELVDATPGLEPPDDVGHSGLGAARPSGVADMKIGPPPKRMTGRS